MIFFIATDVPDSWSLAELLERSVASVWLQIDDVKSGIVTGNQVVIRQSRLLIGWNALTRPIQRRPSLQVASPHI